MFGLNVPNYGGMRYLRIIPGTVDVENLMNSTKFNLAALRSSNLRYSMETYFYKHKNVVGLRRFVASNSKEGLSYCANFFRKLYGGRVNFSTKVSEKLIRTAEYPKRAKIGLTNHGVLRTRRAGAVGGDDFTSSSSILSSVFREIEPFMTENGIIKSAFSFTKGTYSLIAKDRLFRKQTKGMDEMDKKRFFSAFPEGSELFRFRWDVRRNLSANVGDFLQKNLDLYCSNINRYRITERKSPFSTVSDRKRLIGPEAILSHALFVPVSTYGSTRQSPVVLPGKRLYDAGFVITGNQDGHLPFHP